jgi:hypothetical protein
VFISGSEASAGSAAVAGDDDNEEEEDEATAAARKEQRREQRRKAAVVADERRARAAAAEHAAAAAAEVAAAAKRAAHDPRAIWAEDEVPLDRIPGFDAPASGDDGDGRVEPEYEIVYKQRVTAEDVFLNMGFKDPSSMKYVRQLSARVRTRARTHRLCSFL